MNLNETTNWEPGIYQIELTDPVEGGPDGINNRQAKQLASRTQYLLAALGSVTPENYGATGDGVADDTAELQAAIDAAAAKKLPLFLAKTYKVSAALGLKSNSHLTGPGTIVLDAAAATAALAVAPIRILTNLTGGTISDVVLEGLTIDGNMEAWKASVTAANRGSASGGIRLNDVVGLTVRDLNFENCFDGAMTLSSVKDFLVSGVSILNFYGIGITLSSSDRGTISDCTIKDGHELFPTYNRTASNGIFTYDGCKDLTIVGNVVADVTDVGIEIGYQGVSPAENVTVANNSIRGRQTSQKHATTLSAAMAAGDVVANLTDASSYPNAGTVAINGELFDYTGKNANQLTGLTRGTYYTAAAAHLVGDAVNLAVFPSGLFFIGTIGATATGNAVTGCYGDGVKIDKGAKRVAVVGNELSNGYRGINLGNLRDTTLSLEKILVEANIIDAKDFAIYVQGDGATGASNHTEIAIQNNTIWKSANKQAQTGIRVLGTAGKPIKGLSLTGNRITNQGYGINANHIDEAEIRGNILRDCYRPITNYPYYTLTGVLHVGDSAKVVVSENTLINCRAGSGAIKIHNSSKVRAERNRLFDADSPATTLATAAMDVTTGYATIDVADASVLPAPNGAVASRGTFVIIGTEVLEYTAKAGNTLTIRDSLRGFLGSVPAAHAIGDPVHLCAPSILIDADTDCVVKDNEAIGRLARLTDYADLGGASAHTRPFYSGNVAYPDGSPQGRGTVFNVKDFGAKGDGRTDDTVAIQAAIDAAFASKASTSLTHGATVILPPGQYRTKGGLLLKKGVTVEGQSENGATLRWDCDTADAEGIGYCMAGIGNRATPEQLLNVYVKNLTFAVLGATTLDALKPFLLFDYCVEPTVDRIRTSGLNTITYVLTTGIKLVDCQNAQITDFVNDGGWEGLRLEAGAAGFGSKVGRFENLHLYGTRSAGLVMASSDDNLFSGVLIESYSLTAATPSAAYINNSDRNLFAGLSVYTGGANKFQYGIHVDGDCSNNVFNGIAVLGTAGAGVILNATSANNRINGGTIKNCGGDGVSIQVSASYNSLIGVSATDNGGEGFDIINATAVGNVLIGCLARGNTGTGLKAAAGSSSSAIGCQSTGNTGGDINYAWDVMLRGKTFTGTPYFAEGFRLPTLVATATPVAVAATNQVVITKMAAASAVAVNLPAAPVSGQTHTIKDGKGDAAANNVTITPAAGNIDGAANYVLTQNYESVTLIYNGTEWSVIG